jgi:hypothetical protein
LDSLSEILNYTGFAFAGVTLAVGVKRYKMASYGYRAIILLFVASIITDALTSALRGKTWLSYYHLRAFTVLEFIAYTTVFHSIITRRNYRIVMLSLILPFIGVAITDLAIRGVKGRDDLVVSIEAVLIMIYAISALYFILKDMVYPNILNTPHFWMIGAALIYFAGNIFVFTLIAYAKPEGQVTLWHVHTIIACISYALIAIGLWKIRKSH